MTFPTHSTLSLLILATTAGAAVAQGAWSNEMDRPGLIGRVFAIGEWQGRPVAGGLPLQGDGVHHGNVAWFDGVHWVELGGGIHGAEVRDFAAFQGGLVAAGDFVDSVAGGQSAWNIALFDGTDWQPIGGNELGAVFALEVFRGELHAGGEFGIRRWNGVQWVQVGGGVDGQCRALLVGPDDRLYAGGEFTVAGGTSATKVAAWNGSGWSALGGGLGGASNATVWDFAWYQGELWSCGSFDVPGGAPLEKVGIFDGATWRAAGVFPDSSIGTYAYSIEVRGDHLFVGGTIVGTDTVPADRLVRWDGAQWSNVGGVFNGNPTTGVFALHTIAGTLFLGGEFSRLVSYLPGQGIVANSIGAFDGASWSNVGEGQGLDSDPDCATFWNGELVVAGSFAEAGGVVATGAMAFDDTGWRSLGGTSGGTIAGLLAHQGDLYASGSFTAIGGQPAVGVARYDGTTWHALGAGTSGGSALAVYRGELYVGGFGVRRFDGTTWHDLQPQIFGLVEEMHVHNDVLYIAGSLSSHGNIVAWDGAQWASVGGGANAAVYALTTYAGDLIAGGDFTQAGGVNANRLARWNGGTWSAFGGLTGTVVYDLARFEDDLVASGNLFVPGLPPEKYLARFDGNSWSAFGGGFANGAALTSLAVDEANGDLWGAGIVTQADGVPSWYLALWEASPGSPGTAYCAGDGSATACPCGNFGGAGRGCENSFATGGGRLSGAGDASVMSDTLVLHGTSMSPNGSALYFQGTADAGGGGGVVFGDGLRCVGGSVVRLGTHVNSSGASSHPGPGDAPIAAHTGNSAGDVRFYQCWYRNPAPFCTPAVFNLTNGYRVTWRP